jgi:hypothetical protein
MLYADSTTTATAKNNVALGYTALRGSTTAANNTGATNVCIGNNTMLNSTTGSSNVVVGHNAGNDLTTGDKNILIGFGAGDEITTGSNNTIFGDVPGTAALSGNIVFAAGGTEKFRLDSSGRFLIGTSATATSPASSKVQVSGSSQASASQLISRSSADSGGPAIFLAKSRGTKSSPAAVNAGDSVGLILFTAHDGTDFNSRVAAISAQIDGTPGGNDTPGRLIFSTTADAASGTTERMRIKNDGTINFSNVQTFADDTAAGTGGLVAGDVYKTSAGDLKIKA